MQIRFVPAVLLAIWLLTVSSSAQVAPNSATTTAAVAGTREVFQAERFSETFDRVAHRKPAEQTSSNPSEQRTSNGLSGLVGQMLFSLAVVVGLIYGMNRLAQKWGGKILTRSAGPIRVLARQSLTQKKSLVVVDALDRYLVIADGPTGTTCLCEISDPAEIKQLREKWGWEWDFHQTEPHTRKQAGTRWVDQLWAKISPQQSGFSTPDRPSFRHNLQSHVRELEQEIDYLRTGHDE